VKVADLLESRRAQWRELEELCSRLGGLRSRNTPPELLTRFSTLYRAACADLALADAYQLPPATVGYLHQLVGRAHNQLYRSQALNFHSWTHETAGGRAAAIVRRSLPMVGGRHLLGHVSAGGGRWLTIGPASPRTSSERIR